LCRESIREREKEGGGEGERRLERRFGLLFHVGLDLNIRNVNEYNFTLSALEGLITNYSSYF